MNDIQDCFQQVFRITADSLVLILYFDNLCHDRHTDLLRCLSTDVQTNRTFYLADYFLTASFFNQILLYHRTSSPASDHSDISMFLPNDLLQTNLIISVTSGQYNKIRILVSFDLIQGIFKRLADHFRCPRISGMIGKLRTIFKNRDLPSKHNPDFDHRHRYVTTATNDQMLLPSNYITKHLLLSDFIKSAFFQVTCF